MSWAESCAVPTTVHCELPDSAVARLYSDTQAEIHIANITFTGSHEVVASLVYGLFVDAIQAGMIDEDKMDDVFAQHLLTVGPRQPRHLAKGPSR